MGATAIGNYALFAGGYVGNSTVKTVDAYNKVLSRSTAPELNSYTANVAAIALSNYALLALAGLNDQSAKSTVDIYNSSLIKSNSIELSLARTEIGATATKDYALFAGGRGTNNGSKSTVDVYNIDLLRSNPEELFKDKFRIAATTVGEYALFGGGGSTSGDYYSTIVDVYYGNLELTLYKNSRYKFQNMTEEKTVDSSFESILVPTPATGYIKFKNTTIF